MKQEMHKGLLYALMCYGIWGTFPLYWYPLNASAMPAEQIMAQRVLWSAVFALILLLYTKQLRFVLSIFRQPKLLFIFILSAILIGINWLVYLWAITHHHVLEASLGYFINPLVNVLLGYLFLKEKLNLAQFIAITLVVIGILWLAIPANHMPWISLILAFSFGSYALIRKIAPIGALAGLALETFILLPLAVAYLLFCSYQQTFIFNELTLLAKIILFFSGVATTLPLLLFTASAKRISLSLLGILQYISPSLQLMWGIILFHETLNGSRLIGYTWVWLGVVVFLSATWYQSHQTKK